MVLYWFILAVFGGGRLVCQVLTEKPNFQTSVNSAEFKRSTSNSPVYSSTYFKLESVGNFNEEGSVEEKLENFDKNKNVGEIGTKKIESFKENGVIDTGKKENYFDAVGVEVGKSEKVGDVDKIENVGSFEKITNDERVETIENKENINDELKENEKNNEIEEKNENNYGDKIINNEKKFVTESNAKKIDNFSKTGKITSETIDKSKTEEKTADIASRNYEKNVKDESETSPMVKESKDVDENSRNFFKSEVRSQEVAPKSEEVTKNKKKKKGEVKGFIREDGTYVLEDSAEVPCILAYFKAKITVYYPIDADNTKYKDAVFYPPDEVKVTGSCNRDSLTATLNLEWDAGVFTLSFGFDDLTDSWYVGKFDFSSDTSNSASYPKAARKEKIQLQSRKNRRFWATTHSRSFRCSLLHDVTLLDSKDLYSASVHFDEARVQAFAKTKNFKTPKHCIHRVHRSEMVPAVVSGCLAAMSVATVAGYAIFRYFKVKKFQYGTMEAMGQYDQYE